MSKCMITVVTLLVAAIGCKTTPRSEEKGLNVVAKKGKQIAAHTDRVKALFKNFSPAEKERLQSAVQKAKDGELGDLKKLVKEGDSLGEMASVTYYYSFQLEQKELLKEIDSIRKRLDMAYTIRSIKAGFNTTEQSKEALTELTQLFTKRTTQTVELIKSVKSNEVVGDISSEKFMVAFDLCCIKGRLNATSIQEDILREAIQVEQAMIKFDLLRVSVTQNEFDRFLQIPETLTMPSYNAPNSRAKKLNRDFKRAVSDLDAALDNYVNSVVEAVKASS